MQNSRTQLAHKFALSRTSTSDAWASSSPSGNALADHPAADRHAVMTPPGTHATSPTRWRASARDFAETRLVMLA